MKHKRSVLIYCEYPFREFINDIFSCKILGIKKPEPEYCDEHEQRSERKTYHRHIVKIVHRKRLKYLYYGKESLSEDRKDHHKKSQARLPALCF